MSTEGNKKELTLVEDEDDEEFDDFNEPQAAEHVDDKEDDDEDDDDDFGSFDNASFDDFETGGDTNNDQILNGINTDDIDAIIRFDEDSFENSDTFDSKIDTIMDNLFQIPADGNSKVPPSKSSFDMLLNDRSSEIYQQLSRVPHLRPNYWLKLRIRHNLLIKLGIPVNLDELVEEKSSTTSNNGNNNKINENTINHNSLMPPKTHQRRKSINEEDIDWHGFNIPEFETLSISQNEKDELIAKTNEILSKIETDNLNNSTTSYLEQENDQELADKLTQLRENYDQLIKLSSIWNHQFNESKKNFEIYESVVQNFIGYSQKLERDALLTNLKHLKSKSKKRRSLWR